MHIKTRLERGASRNGSGVPEFLAVRVEKYYRERVYGSWGGGHIMHGRLPDSNALLLRSNDYLSISKHPRLLAAMKQALDSNGTGLVMSAVYLHGDCPLLNLENALARFMRAEAGILCQSGWCANVGLIQTIADENTPVYIDMHAHASFWEGIRSANARAIAVLHNDVDCLQRKIRRHGPGIIVVDSIYSTSGRCCPLRDVARTALAHGCVLVVDESHSLGTHGPGGAGLVVELGLADQVHFRSASLAKAFAGRAGFIACDQRFRDYFKYESSPAIFSSALLPHDIAGLQEALAIIQEEDWRRERLHANAKRLRTGLGQLGFELNDTCSQIISLEAGTEKQTIVLRDALESRGIFGSIFCAPATPKNRSLMRFTVNTALTPADLERIIGVCRDIREEVDFANWSSTRRRRPPAFGTESSRNPMEGAASLPMHRLASAGEFRPAES